MAKHVEGRTDMDGRKSGVMIHVQTLLTGLVAAGVGFLGVQFWNMSHEQTRAVETLQELRSSVVSLRADAQRMLTREEMGQYVISLRDADADMQRRIDRMEAAYFDRTQGNRP